MAIEGADWNKNIFSCADRHGQEANCSFDESVVHGNCVQLWRTVDRYKATAGMVTLLSALLSISNK